MGALASLVCFRGKSRVYCEAHTHVERGDCEEVIGLLFRCGGLEYWF